MDIGKQTYLNTIRLEELYERKGEAEATYGDRNKCGVRFRMKRKGDVTLRARFTTLADHVDLYFDGLLIGRCDKPEFRLDLKAEAGEHLFEGRVSGSLGGSSFRAEGRAVAPCGVYADRVGGYSDGDGIVVYLKNGDDTVDKYVYDGSSVTAEPIAYYFYDEAYLYDKTNETYTATKRYCYAGTKTRWSIYVNRTLYRDVGHLRSVALCDGRTLEDGADFLLGFLDDSGELQFMRTVDNKRYDTTCFANIIPGIKRVVSAQRGSVFLVQNAEDVWSGYYFHANGEKELTCTRNTYHYDEIPLCRNALCAPTAIVDETDGSPIFYYKKEDGTLMRLAYGGEPTPIACAEAYHPGMSGGLLQLDGDLRYCELQ